jgi:hypothetical protein
MRPSLAAQKPTWKNAADLARAWGLDQLVHRLMKLRTEARVAQRGRVGLVIEAPSNLVTLCDFFTSLGRFPALRRGQRNAVIPPFPGSNPGTPASQRGLSRMTT